MSKVRVFVIENDFIHSIRLEMYLDEMGYDLAGLAANSNDAINLITATKPDLLLVDINIDGDRDGIQVVEHLNKKKSIPAIFITSYSDKDTFDRAKLTDPYAYIVKPYDKETLQAAIELALYKFSKHTSLVNNIQALSEYQGWNEDHLIQNALFVKSKGRLIKVKLEDIYCIEAKDKICQISLENENIETRISLNGLENKLTDIRFLRVHRSFIINKEKISEINISKNEMCLGAFNVPIGRSYKQSFVKKIDEIIG